MFNLFNNFFKKMNSKGFIEAGKIVRSQGIQGDLIIELCMEIDTNVQLMYLDLTEGDLNIGDSKVAYNVENFSMLDNSSALIKFREVSERSQTNFLEGKSIYVKKEGCYFDKYGNEITNSGLSGYKIFDHEEKKHLGKIIGLQKVKNKYLDRMLMVVEYGNQALPVPFEENIVRHIDHDQKAVFINLPDEFLEVLLTNQ